MKKKYFSFPAHPDDEILGAGGTLIRHRDQADDLAWLIVTKVSEEGGFQGKGWIHEIWK